MAGGGAANRGSGYGDGNGGSSGGFIGNNGESINHTNGFGYGYGTGGTQIAGGTMVWTKGTTDVSKTFPGTFGKGYGSTASSEIAAGGGAGFYGGGGSFHGGAGGGSSYIGNSLLTEKSMYCYNCQESTEESTKTISTTCVSETPTENCAKSGNGHVRITQVSPIVSGVQLETTTIEAQDKVNKSVEVSNKGMTCSLKIKKLSRTEKNDKYSGPTEWTFDYTGGEQTFTAPLTGTYKLETWGAQGGSSTIVQGGYGSYSVGNVLLNKDNKLYINIGGAGLYRKVNQSPYTITGGYNGGGTAYDSSEKENRSSGGGATHVATISGQLSSLSSSVGKIMIVSGGGGGSTGSTGGSAGGIKGVMGAPISGYTIGTGGTQTSGGVCSNSNKYSCTSSLNGSFGKGGNSIRSSDNTTYGGSGGGGGFYGGAAGYDNGAGSGGSGYIGNSLLTEKVMYCYNCTESTEESTKTISTTCVNSTPTENCAKTGNGYARITLIK